MGRDDSWPATVPSVVPTGDCSHWSIHYIHSPTGPFLSKRATCRPGNTQNGGAVLLIGNMKSGFLFKFSGNHMFIFLSFGDIRVWQRDNVDHCTCHTCGSVMHFWFLVILKSRYVTLGSVDNSNGCKKRLVDLTIVSVCGILVLCCYRLNAVE